MAELLAIIEVFKICEEDIKNNISIHIYSDSKIAIGWCTTTGDKYSKNNWKKNKGEIPHVELIKEAYMLYKNFDNVKLEWIKAHTNQTDELSIGNEGADKLANMSIGEGECPYNNPINHILDEQTKTDETKLHFSPGSSSHSTRSGDHSEIETPDGKGLITNQKDNTPQLTQVLRLKKIQYKKKKYYIIIDENPQYIYKIEGDNSIGDKVGIQEIKDNKKRIQFY